MENFQIQLCFRCRFIYIRQDLCLLLWKSNLIFFALECKACAEREIVRTHRALPDRIPNLFTFHLSPKTTNIKWFPYFIFSSAFGNQRPNNNLCSRVCCYHLVKWNLWLEAIVNSWIINSSFDEMLFWIDKNRKRGEGVAQLIDITIKRCF